MKKYMKVLGLVGGAVGAVAATLASGGSITVAILVGVGALTTGASGLYLPQPGKKTAGPGQAVDDEIPKDLRKPGAR